MSYDRRFIAAAPDNFAGPRAPNQVLENLVHGSTCKDEAGTSKLEFMLQLEQAVV